MSGAAAWADALRALTLFAADPVRLGGIVLRAGAGPVRDRFLSLLQAELPPETPFRRMPPHIADDRLLGGLDLAGTLHAGRPVVQKGVLAEADGGVILLAMAERIGPETATRLRAAMDDGVVFLQRDGLSHVMPARFGVIALDEGNDPDERAPASLMDRMAFHLDLTAVSLRDAADLGAPEESGSSPSTTDQAEAILCQTALMLGITSLRAPLLAVRVARVAADLSGHDDVTEADVALAVRLVLGPRAIRFPAPPDEPPPPPEPEDAEALAPDQQTMPDKPPEDVVLDAVKAMLPADLLAQLLSGDPIRGTARAPGRAGQVRHSLQRGRPIGTRAGEPKNGARLHLLETLKAAAPWQNLRHRTDRFQVRRDDFRIVRFRQRIGTTTVFAVDASGSAAMHRLAEAKGAVELLLADCYVRRDQVALIGFRGTSASLLLPPTGSLLRAKRSLAGLPGGGPTPLAAGIDAARALSDGIRRAGRTPVITLLTDARANIARDGSPGRPRAEAEALETARLLRGLRIASLLIDTSPRPNPFARRLADEMQARYVPLPYADASALSRAVRAASAT